MTALDIEKILLSQGYFPRELPPVFTTSDFGEHSLEILAEWKEKSVYKISDTRSLGKIPEIALGHSSRKQYRSGSYSYSLSAADPEIISKPKRGYERRTLHITHPVPQALLVKELAENWRTIQKWLARKSFSIDTIKITKEDRGLKSINFALHREKKEYIQATSDWVVKTDISRFYPSIYTHSIAWAAYGKEKVKRGLQYYKGSFADRLDILVRACNRNQTVGIPIGPESSRIIAEIISSRIDSEISENFRDIPRINIDRLQDDWLVGVESLQKAEAVIAKISSTYREYGLEINGSKTSIEYIVRAKNEEWISEIGSFLSHRSDRLKGSRLREFLTLCIRLQAENASEPVINYALSVIEGLRVAKSDVREMESFLLKGAVVAPNSMDRICRAILDLQHNTNALSCDRIRDRFKDLIEKNWEMGHIFEVIWLLYTLRGLNAQFASRKVSDLSENLRSSAIGLLLLDMKNRGTFRGKLPISVWEDSINEDTILTDWSWLLAYEGFRHGWLQDKHKLMSGVFFEPMARRGVVFYDSKRNIQPSKKHMQKRIVQNKINSAELLKFFMTIRREEMY